LSYGKKPITPHFLSLRGLLDPKVRGSAPENLFLFLLIFARTLFWLYSFLNYILMAVSMEAINKEIKVTICEAQEAYEDYQKLTQNKVDDYLDSGNELKVDLGPLLNRYEQLNDDLLKAINSGDLQANPKNVDKLEKEVDGLVAVTNAFIKALRENPYLPVIKSLVENLEGQINLLHETVEDFKSMLRLSKNEKLDNLLS